MDMSDEMIQFSVRFKTETGSPVSAEDIHTRPTEFLFLQSSVAGGGSEVRL